MEKSMDAIREFIKEQISAREEHIVRIDERARRFLSNFAPDSDRSQEFIDATMFIADEIHTLNVMLEAL
jgi:hypothetical protein